MRVIHGVELLEAEHVLVELRCLLQILHLEREMDDARLLALVLLLVAAEPDDLGEVSVWRAELERALLRIREDRTAVLDDLLRGRLAILDLNAPVMDAGSRTGLCLELFG